MKGSADSSLVACVDVLETEPRVASMPDLDEVAVTFEELEFILARGSEEFSGSAHCLTSAPAVLGREGVYGT